MFFCPFCIYRVPHYIIYTHTLNKNIDVFGSVEYKLCIFNHLNGTELRSCSVPNAFFRFRWNGMEPNYSSDSVRLLFLPPKKQSFRDRTVIIFHPRPIMCPISIRSLSVFFCFAFEDIIKSVVEFTE